MVIVLPANLPFVSKRTPEEPFLDLLKHNLQMGTVVVRLLANAFFHSLR